MVRDNHLPKSDFELLKERMMKLASSEEPKEHNLQQQLRGMFADKKCSSIITNP
jgi:hypothetical protein